MPNPLIFYAKSATVYAMAEGTAGTPIADASLFVAGNILGNMQDVSMEIKPEMVKRNPDGPSDQSITTVIGQVPVGVKFGHRLFGSGVAGTAPKYGPLWKACWLSETIVASTSVTYASNIYGAPSLTLGFEVLSNDGTAALRYVASGVNGNFTFKGDKIQAPLMVTYDFTGAFQLSGGATTTPVGVLTYPAETALAVRFGTFAGTPTGLFVEECDSIEFNRGQKADMATSIVNANGLLYALPSGGDATLKVGYRTRTKALMDTLNQFGTGTRFANSLQLGTTAGSIFTVSTNSNAQFEAVSNKKFNAAYGYEATLGLHRTETSSASDAFALAFT
jgi:hypothetical protein